MSAQRTEPTRRGVLARLGGLALAGRAGRGMSQPEQPVGPPRAFEEKIPATGRLVRD